MKYKKGDIIVVTKIYPIGGTSEKAAKEYNERYQEHMGEVESVYVSSSYKSCVYLTNNITIDAGELYESEIRHATKREKFLYHIFGPEALR